MATISVRTDPKLKKAAQKTLKALGLDISSAINVYLQQIVFTQSIPFRIRTENGFSPEEERRMLQEEAEALKSGKRYSTAEELHRDILGDKRYEEWLARSSAHNSGGKVVQARPSSARAQRKVRPKKTRRRH